MVFAGAVMSTEASEPLETQCITFGSSIDREERVEVLTFCYSFIYYFLHFIVTQRTSENYHIIMVRSRRRRRLRRLRRPILTLLGNVFLRSLRCSSSDAHRSDKKTRTAARRNGPETTTTGALIRRKKKNNNVDVETILQTTTTRMLRQR